MNSIITDNKTNTVYFSKYIEPYKTWKEIKPILTRLNIQYDFVLNTADLWVRDFMPVQINDNKFIQFVYNPSYLIDKPKYLTKVELCKENLSFKDSICKSDIILDGGNIIKCDESIILTDKVFEENPGISKNTIIKELEDLFQCELVLIPHDPLEKTGHADGMIRYIGQNTVLLNHYIDFDKPLRNKLLQALAPKFNIVELHYGTSRNLPTSWAYLNYLQIGENIFVPTFKNKLDEVALLQLESVLKTKVYPIYSRSIVKIGGGLNCASWTIKI